MIISRDVPQESVRERYYFEKRHDYRKNCRYRTFLIFGEDFIIIRQNDSVWNTIFNDSRLFK